MEEEEAERDNKRMVQQQRKNGILTLFMIMNARQHIYVKIMQFAAVLCQCVEWLKDSSREGEGNKEKEHGIDGAKSQEPRATTVELSQSIKS